MTTTYAEFLAGKARRIESTGREPDSFWPGLYPFQRDVVSWAVRRGRAAVFLDCGLGKTLVQLEWLRHFAGPGGGRGLIVAPLGVAEQTIREAKDRLGLEVRRARERVNVDAGDGLWITNYDRLERFIGLDWRAVVLDESSILKSHDGATRTELLRQWTCVPWRLSCTATPAPNDVTELCNQAEFVGAAPRVEVLAEFFVHDSDDTRNGSNGWRLKGHAADAFWRWLATWAVFARRPSDLGHADDGFALPQLTIRDETVTSGLRNVSDELIPGSLPLGGVGARLAARRNTLEARVARSVEVIQADREQWVVWCALNDEGRGIARALGEEAVLIEGSDSEAEKIEREATWRAGRARVLVTKPRIFGLGMNWQHCAHMLFLGLGDSYEQYYQAIRRCWRFGQLSPVEVTIVTGDIEGEVVANVRRKEREAATAADAVVAVVRDQQIAELCGNAPVAPEVREGEASGPSWQLLLGDCVERVREIETGSVGLSVFSPPFASLYTYSASERDMGNSRGYDQFFEHFGFLVPELLRVTIPGRRACVHVQQVSTTLAVHGVIGWRDFRADVVRAFVAAGWVYDGEVVIDKDPQAQAIRTKSKQLLFVQKARDSAWLRPAMADYILCFRAPGENPQPIKGDLTNDEWIEWARPIWYGIRESDTLRAHAAREEKDERHICPLQLGTIRRCVRLWSAPGDLVLDPFAGIGSTGYVALELERRFVGIELKPAYWRQAVANLKSAHQQLDLFAGACS